MQLFKEQRIELEKLLEAEVTKVKIAMALGVHLSTIYREIKRNSVNGNYSGEKAHQLATARKKVVGSLRKYKTKDAVRRKNKYELYAQRRFIYWHSDTPWQRKKYFIVYSNRRWRFTRYKIRWGLEKLYHYRNDIELISQLIQFEEEKWKVEHTVLQSKKIHQKTKPQTKTIVVCTSRKEVA
ncbi:helix-turn-helix domain-containing protein [Flammeovirga kamogawensis]|uniref:Helix-turn-helix domain-containing protein n=1 Tax=Flammeovirga kamogawensis TaxID=373891 RepID=A0ABX8H2Y8_9BACT|nr:helix-turn-helix domain-containing protein [Flammeovirga kamogawensis]MBB6460464.1 hypothetical protein [Flammeovirga kamogawensis]QWG10270.1 helix-turn-helix domain-containing protein [Flammeovirga kamogawensis]TRX64718.1 helix-turn-helix domain-containing protein [Flammeovirga kamogawensis]